MAVDGKKRDFLGMSFAAVTAVGDGASLYGMKKAWDPLPSVLSAGFTTVNIGGIKAGEPVTYTWRGKPIFVLKKTAEMEQGNADLVIGSDRYTVRIGLCTHLGCIPSWKANMWKCACHGGEFDANGKNTFGPPPRPFDIPPFSLSGTTIKIGEVGEECKAMMAANNQKV
jgi:ubiquinol-cytochrome c reductase iron-sulfur subunit